MENFAKLCGLLIIIFLFYMSFQDDIDFLLHHPDLTPKTSNIDENLDLTLKTSNIDEKPNMNVTELELLIHENINEIRVSYGLKELEWDQELSNIAKQHSEDMAINNYFKHINLEGDDSSARGLNNGYECVTARYYGIAENIFQNNLYDLIIYSNGAEKYHWNTKEEIVTTTVDGWMNSPGHKENILTEHYNKEGIGIAISEENFKVYVTQNFC